MPKMIEDSMMHAVKIGNGIHKWVDAKTLSGAAQTLTDATMYYNIPVGSSVFITMLYLDLETVSDDVHMHLVKAAEVAGGGAVVQISGHLHTYTAAAQVTHATQVLFFDVPIEVAYGTGALSITVNVTGNDSSAVISAGWCGWMEKTDPIT